VALPVGQGPTSVPVNPTVTDVGAWDVRDAVMFSLSARNTGAEAVTLLPVHSRLHPAEDFAPSGLEWQPSSTIQPGETARVDIDTGAVLEVAARAQAAAMGSTLVVTARADGGKRR
jgi:hypothetical protein